MKHCVTVRIVCILILLADLAEAQQISNPETYVGKIGNSSIVLELEEKDHWQGTYFYTNYNKLIEISSDYHSDHTTTKIRLNEFVDGKNTGYFLFKSADLRIKKQKLKGKWYSVNRTKEMDVLLIRQAIN